MRRMFPAAACLVLLAWSPLSSQSATITGRVTDSKTGQPVAGTQVSVTGYQLGAAVDAEGRYRIAGVPIAAKEVRALGIPGPRRSLRGEMRQPEQYDCQQRCE